MTVLMFNISAKQDTQKTPSLVQLSGESMIQLPIHKLVLNSEPLTSILLLLFFLYHSMAKILRVSNSTSVDSSCFHE